VKTILIIIATLLVLVGCSGEYAGQVGANAVYSVCDHGNRVYTSNHGSIAVSPADPSCKEAK
jgi:hypothetical protein